MDYLPEIPAVFLIDWQVCQRIFDPCSWGFNVHSVDHISFSKNKNQNQPRCHKEKGDSKGKTIMPAWKCDGWHFLTDWNSTTGAYEMARPSQKQIAGVLSVRRKQTWGQICNHSHLGFTSLILVARQNEVNIPNWSTGSVEKISHPMQTGKTWKRQEKYKWEQVLRACCWQKIQVASKFIDWPQSSSSGRRRARSTIAWQSHSLSLTWTCTRENGMIKPSYELFPFKYPPPEFVQETAAVAVSLWKKSHVHFLGERVNFMDHKVDRKLLYNLYFVIILSSAEYNYACLMNKAIDTQDTVTNIKKKTRLKHKIPATDPKCYLLLKPCSHRS